MRGAAAGRQRTAMTAVACPLADPFAAAEQAYATITEFLRSEKARQVNAALRGNESERASSLEYQASNDKERFNPVSVPLLCTIMLQCN